MTHQTRAEAFGTSRTYGTNRKPKKGIHDLRNAILIAIHVDGIFRADINYEPGIFRMCVWLLEADHSKAIARLLLFRFDNYRVWRAMRQHTDRPRQDSGHKCFVDTFASNLFRLISRPIYLLAMRQGGAICVPICGWYGPDEDSLFEGMAVARKEYELFVQGQPGCVCRRQIFSALHKSLTKTSLSWRQYHPYPMEKMCYCLIFFDFFKNINTDFVLS